MTKVPLFCNKVQLGETHPLSVLRFYLLGHESGTYQVLNNCNYNKKEQQHMINRHHTVKKK